MKEKDILYVRSQVSFLALVEDDYSKQCDLLVMIFKATIFSLLQHFHIHIHNSFYTLSFSMFSLDGQSGTLWILEKRKNYIVSILLENYTSDFRLMSKINEHILAILFCSLTMF